MSPWHSRVKPSALRWLNSALRRSKLLSAQACRASSCSRSFFVAEEWRDLFEVLAHRGHYAVRGPRLVFGRDFWRAEVESGDLLGHFINVLGGQLTVGLQGAEQAGLRELTHFQHIFDHRAVASQLRRFDAAGHRQHVQIQIFGQALIQTQFFSAEVLARLEAGEVESRNSPASSLYKQTTR